MNVVPDDYIGAPVDTFFSSLEPGRSARHAHECAIAGEDCTFNIEVRGRDLEAHVQPLRELGEIVGVIGVALDVTERKVTERQLRFSEQSYRSLIEEAPYAICRSTLSGQLLQVNRAMLDMLGYESEPELLVCDLRGEIFSNAEAFDDFRARLLDRGACQGFESTWLHQKGMGISVNVGGRAVSDHEGEILYLDILAENVSDRRQLEAQLRQAQKMQAIGQLAGGIAHDFNNLLTVIRGQVEVMLGETQGNGSLHRRMEEVERAAERASKLTRQLLAFSRRQVLQSKTIDLNHVIGGMSQMLSRLITENIELTFIPASDLACVRADPSQIEQVLMNLVVNARDAMPNGGRLTVETFNVHLDGSPAQLPAMSEPGDYVVISVKDTGQGMDRDTQARIFEPFFTTKEMGEGTGLGLAMVYGVVKQSGGYIRVQSEPQQGATFEIYLPSLVEPRPDDTAQGARVPVVSPPGTETILLAEDEPGLRQLVADFLSTLGYQVLSASDGAAALKVAQAHRGSIDLLLTDIVMPKKGGRELAADLRKSLPEVKVILVSGYTGNAGDEPSLPGAYFLQKPFTMQILAKTVRAMLDGHPL